MHNGFSCDSAGCLQQTQLEEKRGYPSSVPLKIIIIIHIFILVASPLVDLVLIVSIWVSGGKVWENSSASVDLEYGH